MPTTRIQLTYEEYLNEPYTLSRFDIVDGEVFMSAGPTRPHQLVSGNIYRPVHSFVTGRGMGEVLYAPVDVVVQRDPLRVRQPDLLYVSYENAGILGDRIEGGPDLAVEILSPSNRRSDIEEKLSDYAQVGVKECWLFAPDGRTVETLQLDGGEWKRLAIRSVGENVETMVLLGLELAVSDIFRGG